MPYAPKKPLAFLNGVDLYTFWLKMDPKMRKGKDGNIDIFTINPVNKILKGSPIISPTMEGEYISIPGMFNSLFAIQANFDDMTKLTSIAVYSASKNDYEELEIIPFTEGLYYLLAYDLDNVNMKLVKSQDLVTMFCIMHRIMTISGDSLIETDPKTGNSHWISKKVHKIAEILGHDNAETLIKEIGTKYGYGLGKPVENHFRIGEEIPARPILGTGKGYVKKEKKISQVCVDPDGSFGKIKIDVNDLKHNILTVSQNGNTTLKIPKVSNVLKDLLLEKRLPPNILDQVQDHDAQIYRDLVDMANVRLKFGTIRRSIADIPSQKIKSPYELKRRLDLLLAAKMAGNNSKIIEAEIKHIVRVLRKDLDDKSLKEIEGKGISLHLFKDSDRLIEVFKSLLEKSHKSLNLKNELLLVADELEKRGIIKADQLKQLFDRFS